MCDVKLLKTKDDKYNNIISKENKVIKKKLYRQ